MAQVECKESHDHVKAVNKEKCSNGDTNVFKFNVHAREFVPRSQSQMPQQSSSSSSVGFFYPYLQFFGGGRGAALGPEWFYLAEQEHFSLMPDFHCKVAASQSKNNNDTAQKIVKQVEYQFSDSNLVASDFLMKIMNKDPEGFVPMSVIASWKKIKSLGVNNHTIIKALRTSPKLVVSEDGKKVRRKHLFSERDKEKLQSRMVVVENLPEDYSRQNIEKIFGAVGSVKNIRICHPQEPNSPRLSKNDVLISNKLHAFVEFATTDQAEKAVEKLNDERNWRKGLRVRTVLRCSPRSVIRSKRSDYDHFDTNSDEDQSPSSRSLSSPRIELLELNSEENQSGARKGWGRGRAKLQSHSGRGQLSQVPQSGAIGHCEASSKPTTPQGPRMPDGTRGFNMGRGKLMMNTVLGQSPIPAAAVASLQL